MGRTQREIAEAVAEELDLPHRTGVAFLQRVIDLVADDLAKTGRMELRGLGTFQVVTRKAHNTKHPKTGKPVHLKARKTVRYRSSLSLKRQINE